MSWELPRAVIFGCFSVSQKLENPFQQGKEKKEREGDRQIHTRIGVERTLIILPAPVQRRYFYGYGVCKLLKLLGLNGGGAGI